MKAKVKRQKAKIKSKILSCLLPTVLLLTGSLWAQQAKKVPRIGYLTALSIAIDSSRIEALRQGLRELGYVEDKNIIIEWRFAEGKLDRLSALVAELVHLKPDVILSAGAAVTSPLHDATRTIPIVMAQDTDAVGNGFVSSPARPGGNITGLSSYSAELNGKRLELLKEIIPKFYPSNTQSLKETELAAEALKVQLQYVDVLHPKDIPTAFRQASEGHADGILTLQSAVLNSQRTQTADLAIRNRLPAIYYAPEFLDAGGLMSYATSITDLYRRAATYIDKILKGATPGDLPVEQPNKFELMINLKAAKQIGVTIPPNVLARVDRVIR